MRYIYAIFLTVVICVPAAAQVDTLTDEQMQARQHQVVWDASGQSSGVYFYRIEAGDYIEIRPMVYLK